MKQTIEIEVPEGKKAIWKDGKIVFEDIKPQLPKTWEEFCEKTPIRSTEAMIDNDSRMILMKNVCSPEYNRDSFTDKSILLSEQAAKQHLALMQLHQLRDYYRQGWKPTEDKVFF